MAGSEPEIEGATGNRAGDETSLSQRIRVAVIECLDAVGYAGTSLHRIQERAGVSRGALTYHFASKEDLLVTLAARNCLARRELFERAALWPGPSRERMLAIGIADTFLLAEQPELFRLSQYTLTAVVWGAASAERRAQSLDASEPLGGLVMGIIRDAVDSGELPNAHGLNETELCLGPWTICLGMHTLVHAEGVLRDRVPAPYRLMFLHLQMLLNGYGWQPLFDPAHEDLDALVARLARAIFDRDPPPLALPR